MGALAPIATLVFLRGIPQYLGRVGLVVAGGQQVHEIFTLALGGHHRCRHDR
jgi:hypothetical protein